MEITDIKKLNDMAGLFKNLMGWYQESRLMSFKYTYLCWIEQH